MEAARVILPAVHNVPHLGTQCRISTRLKLFPRDTYRERLERISDFYDKYIRSNLPPLSLTRFQIYGQFPVRPKLPNLYFGDYAIRQDALCALIYSRRSLSNSDLTKEEWEEIFQITEYGDCQHIASYVHKVLESYNNSKGISELLPDAILVIMHNSFYEELTRSLELINKKFKKKIKDMNETELHASKTLCHQRGFRLIHMFNVVNLPPNIQNQLQLHNTNNPGEAIPLSKDFSEINNSIIIDGWSQHLTRQTLAPNEIKEVFSGLLNYTSYVTILLHPKHDIARLLLN